MMLNTKTYLCMERLTEHMLWYCTKHISCCTYTMLETQIRWKELKHNLFQQYRCWSL